MPFIYIDNGNMVNRPYQSLRGPSIKQVSKGAPSAIVHKQDDPGAQQQKHPHGKPSAQQAVKQYTASEPDTLTRHRVRHADEIMSAPVITLDVTHDTPHLAWQKMQQHHIRHIPVVDQGKLVAMVCERDLLLHALNNKALPDSLDKIMIKQVHAALPDTDIHQLAHLMFDERIGSLPIVDAKRQVLGIVTRYDILKVMSAYGPMEYWA